MFVWTFSVFVILAKASYDIREMGFLDLWNSGKLPWMAGISLILCLLLFWLGWFCERNRRPIEGSQSMGQKNTTLVIWISTLYAGPVVALAPTCYVVWQNLVLSWMSRKKL
jgi:BASS family bile acid:Na+ symporter